jgi:hypothetical protein
VPAKQHLDQGDALERAESEAAVLAEKIGEAIELRSRRFARVMLERAAAGRQASDLAATHALSIRDGARPASVRWPQR